MKRRCAALFAVLALILTGCAQETQTASTTGENTQDAMQTAEVTSAPALTIALADLSSEPTLVDWTQDGIAMQLIALKDADGTPRLAYNTCQVCAGSPYAYFEYQDGMLICQNCGNAFPLASVGADAGGCNPLPVDGFETRDGKVILSAETLSAASASFRNWKAFS